MRTRPGPSRGGSRSGVALIVVLWVSAALTLLLYAFLGEMQVEYALAGGFGDEKKAEQLAWSAIDYGCVTVDNDTKTWQALWDPWSDEDADFYEFPLGEGAFSLLHPTYADDGRMMWGLEDEASKINVNFAPKEVLLRLPGVTEEIADSIIDWRDADSNPGGSGAESSYYQGLSPPYSCKNEPFESIEELLFVRGMTPEILFGKDKNLNGRFEKGEVKGTSRPDPPLWSLVTVWSADRNVSADGQPRVNLNTATNEQLAQAGLQPAEIQTIFVTRLSRGPFPSVAHLLGDPQTGAPEVLPKARYKLVADRLTVIEGESVPGALNINTAPKPVLLCLPGITEELAVKIIGYRTPPGTDLSNTGWLTDVLEPRQLQQISNWITVRSYQYRMNAVGRVGTPYGDSASGSGVRGRPGALKRMLAVYDKLAQPRPRLVYWKDVTKLGLPYDPTQGPDQVP